MLGDLSCLVVFLRVGLVVVGAVHAPLPSFPHLALIYLHFHFWRARAEPSSTAAPGCLDAPCIWSACWL